MAGVVVFYAIVHFTHEQAIAAFREVYRVLAPGGLLLLTYHIGQKTVCIDPFLGHQVDVDLMLFSSDFIAGNLKNIGFEQITIIERGPYPGIEYDSRRAYAFAQKPIGSYFSTQDNTGVNNTIPLVFVTMRSPSIFPRRS
jgi:hypothetical protein